MSPHMDGWIIPDEKIPVNGRAHCEPVKEGHPCGALWRYGMLCACLFLLGRYTVWFLGLSEGYPYDRYATGICGLMLLFNHLAYSFRWPRVTGIAIRFLSHGWMIFAIIWVSYLSKRIYG